MKRALLLAGLVLAMASAAAAQPAQTYLNARFRYSVAFPPGLLRALPEADNGDGRDFARPNAGPVIASVWGQHDALGWTPAQFLRDFQTDCGGSPPSYRSVRRTSVVASCRTGGEILYHRVIRRGDVLINLRLRYPVAERGTWDPVVQSMSASLRAH